MTTNDRESTTKETISDMKAYLEERFTRIEEAIAGVGIKVFNMERTMDRSTKKLNRITRKGELKQDDK